MDDLKLDEIIPGVIGGLITGLPTALFFYWIGQAVWSRLFWRSVPGTITRTGLYSEGKGESVRHHVRYRYEVGGREYDGERVSFGDTLLGNKKAARAIADRYPHGKAVTVFHDPNDPESAVLERSVVGWVWAGAAIGLFFFGGIVGALLGFWE